MAPEEPEFVDPQQLLTGASNHLERMFDSTHGGFGAAPKFPHATDLQLLLRVWYRWRREAVMDMVRVTLDKMARGGIYDHLGGGFARYAVDQRWLVPHFEKMLYDNAQLANCYLDGYLATGDPQLRRVAQETLDYVLRDMTDPLGGFHSTEDADSEGQEGRFYVWTPDQVREVLGAEAAERFCYVYDVSEEGNFEGHSVLNLPKTLPQCARIKNWDLQELEDQLAADRAKLLAARQRRIRPGKDDKILVSWNGLMIDAMARAATICRDDRYLQGAVRAAQFIQRNLVDHDGRLLHSWRMGRAKLHAYLDDYACLANAAVSLYEATWDERWIDEAVALADAILKRFRDPQHGGFFFTPDDQKQTLVRHKEIHDSSVPSSNAMAATVLLRLGALCGRADYLTAANETVDGAARVMKQSPSAVGQMLVALDMQWGPLSEIVVIGDPADADTAEVLADLRGRWIPNRVVACRAQADVADGSVELDPIFLGRQTTDAAPVVYVCQRFVCGAPAHGKDAAKRLWESLAAPPQPAAAK